MLLTRQQEYMLEVLNRLGCIRTEQLAQLVRRQFSIPSQESAQRIVHAALRQLAHGNTELRLDEDIAFLGRSGIDHDHLEAVGVMLELADDALPDFAAEPPILLRFVIRQKQFAVVSQHPPLMLPRFLPSEKVIVLQQTHERPTPWAIPNTQIFAVRQEDGSHRFLTRK